MTHQSSQESASRNIQPVTSGTCVYFLAACIIVALYAMCIIVALYAMCIIVALYAMCSYGLCTVLCVSVGVHIVDPVPTMALYYYISHINAGVFLFDLATQSDLFYIIGKHYSVLSVLQTPKSLEF